MSGAVDYFEGFTKPDSDCVSRAHPNTARKAFDGTVLTRSDQKRPVFLDKDIF
jgi:hypothetical protein